MPVIEALRQLGVGHYIGGSVASGAFGEFRATNDVDVVADLREVHAEPLVAALGDAYYAELDSVRRAVRCRGGFNVIHLRTMLKIDLFVQKDRDYDRAALGRRVTHLASHAPGAPSLDLASPEDVILAKLEWYRQGGEVSERQWRDILGVIRVQSAALDLAYLRRWAAELGVTELLERALAEAGAA
jgi:hypothetical protein